MRAHPGRGDAPTIRLREVSGREVQVEHHDQAAPAAEAAAR
jgi:hypothetical protein